MDGRERRWGWRLEATFIYYYYYYYFLDKKIIIIIINEGSFKSPSPVYLHTHTHTHTHTQTLHTRSLNLIPDVFYVAGLHPFVIFLNSL